MPSVSEELRRERELRGISLDEIADETKIGVRFLDAIDSDRMEIIPGEFYRRASLKAYATYLGIDAERILATYEFQTATKTLAPQLLREDPRFVATVFRSRAARWAALGVAVLGLSGAALAVWPGREGARPSRFTSPTTPVTESNEKVAARSVVQGDSAPGPVIRDEIEEEPAVQLPLRVIVRVNEPCWLEIRADGDIMVQGLMLRGFERKVQAREEIRFWLGNAAGVSIWLNEQPGRSLGGPGQVRKDLLITPDNYMEFVESRTDTDVVPVSTHD